MGLIKRLLLVALLTSAPTLVLADESLKGDPDVTIRQDGDRVIEEYRVNGFLYAIKITPTKGKPYFLVRADGSDGKFIRADDPDMLIPSWQIFSW